MNWTDASTIAAAAATVALTIFAAAQLLREHRATAHRKAATAARMSALGYLLHRELRTWIGDVPDDEERIEMWTRDSQNAGTLAERIGAARSLLLEMMSLLADASAAKAAPLREAFVHFLEGSRRIQAYASQSRPSSAALFDWIQLRADAHADFRECIGALERGAIEPGLLNAETISRRTRAQEEPFQQLADAMVSEMRAHAKGEVTGESSS